MIINQNRAMNEGEQFFPPKLSLLINAETGSYEEGDKLKLFHISLRLSRCIFSLIDFFF